MVEDPTDGKSVTSFHPWVSFLPRVSRPSVPPRPGPLMGRKNWKSFRRAKEEEGTGERNKKKRVEKQKPERRKEGKEEGRKGGRMEGWSRMGCGKEEGSKEGRESEESGIN